jgi:hypothetical protein
MNLYARAIFACTPKESAGYCTFSMRSKPLVAKGGSGWREKSAGERKRHSMASWFWKTVLLFLRGLLPHTTFPGAFGESFLPCL